MTTSIHGGRLAALAAALAASSFAFAAPAPAGSSGKALSGADTVHCYGLNSCKGMNDCKTTEHACKGQGSCKGMGFKGMKASECLANNGVIGDLK